MQLVVVNPPRLEPITVDSPSAVDFGPYLDRLWYAAHRDRHGVPIMVDGEDSLVIRLFKMRSKLLCDHVDLILKRETPNSCLTRIVSCSSW